MTFVNSSVADAFLGVERRPASERRLSENQRPDTWRPSATGLVQVRRSSGERYIDRRPSSHGAPMTITGGSGSGGDAAHHSPSDPLPTPPPQYSFLPPPPFGGRPPSPMRAIQQEHVIHPEGRLSSPILRAESTADDLFQSFISLPPPVHLQHQPKEAVVWHWTSWLIRVRGIDEDDARTMAEVYVDARWRGHEEISRRETPTFQQSTEQGINDPSTRWELDAGNSRTFPRDTEREALFPHRETARPQVHFDAGQDLQTSRIRRPASPSPASHRRIHSDPAHGFQSPSHHPSQNLRENSNARTPANQRQPTYWKQITYLPPTASSISSSQPSLEQHLTNAVETALAASRDLDEEGENLYLDARFRIPVPVARAMARGIGFVDLAGSLSDVRAFVPVVGERVGEGEDRRASRAAEDLAEELAEDLALEEAQEWDRARVPKWWSY